MRILILEDEKMLATSMKEFLEDSGYEVEHYPSSDEAFDTVFERVFDLMLLDVKVHGRKNGFEMLEELRKEGIKIPAIFITSLTDIDDLTYGYECGACDYIRKPFDLIELKLRIDQVIKLHCFGSDEERIPLPYGYSYDLNKMKFERQGETIQLAKTETKIMELLVKHRGSVVSYQMFWEEIWGEWIDPSNIRVQVGNLRKRLDHDLIKNIRGVGYSIDL
ncbi:response regulator transcription factor [Sulfurovum sp.]|jgi:DNA-binding response OmpR family regulator|uniref:response regulator transcription factor n=1 Tax=Sulfurovum sp. TaxID=1969726 RepID=UPI002A359615|nr:response regulator transcription factor [Sulfurovum sp.]MDD2451336.1 response regulator transcription factor [Sulfurovum sp.]MDD3499833.1 response regulator transcription factor [Sulfurovum sp.]MDY0403135.1 response regulator transcription factor [Sulfurovum sp.]